MTGETPGVSFDKRKPRVLLILLSRILKESLKDSLKELLKESFKESLREVLNHCAQKKVSKIKSDSF